MKAEEEAAKLKAEEEHEAAKTKAEEEQDRSRAESKLEADEEATNNERGDNLGDMKHEVKADANAPVVFDQNLEKDANLLLRPIVICGPSGAGKGTLVESLLKSYPDDQFGFSVSHTTRKPRDGEIDGLHYNFASVEEMKKDIDSGKFIEYAAVHGNFYGTSFEAVKTIQSQNRVCILDIDVKHGVRNVKRSSLHPYYIFIAPPSMEDLEARLRGRGTENEDDIQKRLKHAAEEMKHGKEGNFDKYLVNDDLASASKELSETVKSWYPHLSQASENGNAFVKHCAACVIS